MERWGEGQRRAIYRICTRRKWSKAEACRMCQRATNVTRTKPTPTTVGSCKAKFFLCKLNGVIHRSYGGSSILLQLFFWCACCSWPESTLKSRLLYKSNSRIKSLPNKIKGDMNFTFLLNSSSLYPFLPICVSILELIRYDNLWVSPNVINSKAR